MLESSSASSQNIGKISFLPSEVVKKENISSFQDHVIASGGTWCCWVGKYEAYGRVSFQTWWGELRLGWESGRYPPPPLYDIYSHTTSYICSIKEFELSALHKGCGSVMLVSFLHIHKKKQLVNVIVVQLTLPVWELHICIHVRTCSIIVAFKHLGRTTEWDRCQASVNSKHYSATFCHLSCHAGTLAWMKRRHSCACTLFVTLCSAPYPSPPPPSPNPPQNPPMMIKGRFTIQGKQGLALHCVSHALMLNATAVRL